MSRPFTTTGQAEAVHHLQLPPQPRRHRREAAPRRRLDRVGLLLLRAGLHRGGHVERPRRTRRADRAGWSPRAERVPAEARRQDQEAVVPLAQERPTQGSAGLIPYRESFDENLFLTNKKNQFPAIFFALTLLKGINS